MWSSSINALFVFGEVTDNVKEVFLDSRVGAVEASVSSVTWKVWAAKRQIQGQFFDVDVQIRLQYIGGLKRAYPICLRMV
jgi:hypothetical protein